MHDLISSDRSKRLENITCAVAYITMFPAAMMLILPPTVRNPRIRFHACQSILMNWFLVAGTFLVGLIASLQQLIDGSHSNGFKLALWIVTIAVWSIAVIRVATGKEFRIPVIGALAEKQANGGLFAQLGRVPAAARETGDQAHPLTDASLPGTL